jgi:hypothetical protein
MSALEERPSVSFMDACGARQIVKEEHDAEDLQRGQQLAHVSMVALFEAREDGDASLGGKV